MDFKKFYDEHSEYVARRAEGSRNYKEYIQEISFKTEFLLKVIDQNKQYDSILEVGCANGILIDMISKKLGVKGDVFGIDISEKNISDASKRFPNIQFYEGTIESFIMSHDKEFDLVVLSDIIEHVPDDLDFLKQVGVITKQVVINLPLEKSFNNRNRNYGENDSSGHLRSYSYNDGVALIEKAGFEIICYKRVISIRDSEDMYGIYKTKQKERLKNKGFAKRMFWGFFYYMKDSIIMKNSYIYRKLYGENLYCLAIKSA